MNDSFAAGEPIPRDGTVECGGQAWAIGFVAIAMAIFSAVPARIVVPVFLHDPNYSHGLLFPGLALLLAWHVRARLAAAGNGAQWPGFLLLAAGAGVVIADYWLFIALRPSWRGHVFLQAAGWLTAAAGVVWALIGWPRFRILAPRLGFLIFMIPLPDTWLLPLTLALQRAVAIGSAGLLRALGVVVFREGDLLHFASITLGVAGACSGIRSLMTFFATAAVCAVLLDLGVKRTLLLLALSPVAAVGSNVLRVIATSLLAIRWGRVWLEGVWHDALGLVAVLLGGALLYAAAQGLRRTSPSAGAFPVRNSAMRRRPNSLRAALAATAILLATTLGMSHMSRHYAQMAKSVQIQPVERRPFTEFPSRIGRYQLAGDFQLASFELDMLRPSDQLIRTYVDESDNEMRLTVLYWEPQLYKPGASVPPPVPHSPNLCWRYEGWEPVRSEMPISFNWMPNAMIEVSLFEKTGQERLVLYWRPRDAGAPSLFSPAEMRNRLHALIRSWREVPEGWGAPPYQVRIDTAVEENPNETHARTLDFARQVAELLPDYGIGRTPGSP